jgi:hypothetical protein
MRIRLLSAAILSMELMIAYADASPPVGRRILIDGEADSESPDEFVWLGFSPDNRYIASFRRTKTVADLCLHSVADGELRKKDSFPCYSRRLAFGPPAVFDASGSHLAYLTDSEVLFWPIGAAQPSKPIGLSREWPLPLYGGSASLWAHSTEGSL